MKSDIPVNHRKQNPKRSNRRHPPAVQNAAVQDDSPALIQKTGKMTYIVRVHFSTTSKETFEDKVKRMLCEEVCQMMANK